MNICFHKNECKNHDNINCNSNSSCAYLSCPNIKDRDLCEFAGCHYDNDNCREIDPDNPKLDTCETKCFDNDDNTNYCCINSNDKGHIVRKPDLLSI